MLRRLPEWAVTWPKLTVARAIAATMVFAAWLPRMRTDTDPKNMLPVTSDMRVFNRQVEQWFGLHEDMIVVGIVRDGGVFEYYGEFMRQHDAYLRTLPPGLPARDQVRQVASLRATQLRRHQTLRLNLFVMASPTDRDAYINSSVRYNVTDELWLETGANVFGGQERHTFSGQFERNSAVFLVARYEF